MARAIGVGESTIKRWVDDGLISAVKTAGGHRRITVAEVVRFVRSRNMSVVEPQVLGLSGDPRAGEGSSPDLGGQLADHLKAGRERECRDLLLSLYASGITMAQLGDGPIRAAMGEVGLLWLQDRERGIYLEHRATQICLRICQELWQLGRRPRERRVLAVGGAPGDDPYQLPSLLVAASLEELGFEAVNLGPKLPLFSLGRAIEDMKPALAWLSISDEADLEQKETAIEALWPRLERSGTTLVIGGRVSGRLRLKSRQGLLRCESLADLGQLVA